MGSIGATAAPDAAAPPDAIVRFLSHDLRSPLGPLTLALSSIVEDGATPDSIRELAAIAASQADRIGRLIDAAVLAARRPRLPEARPVAVAEVLAATAREYAALGGACELRAVDAFSWRCDALLLRNALLGLLEAAGGEGGTVLLEARLGPGGLAIEIAAAHAGTWHFATEPSDAPSVFVLAARHVLGSYGGEVRANGGTLHVRLPEGTP